MQIINGPDVAERTAASFAFIPVLVRALKIPGSFEYTFDSVKSMRITYAPDREFRIFTWFVNINNIAYRYYGAIQMNTTGKLKLFPLIDYTDHISKPEDTITEAKKWYGAEYYSILPADKNGNYVLLGWKGISDQLNSRLIDVLHFDEGKPFFGAPIFLDSLKKSDRVLFKYTRQASMMLKYLAKNNRIVFDHLSAPDPKLKGKFEFYGPDLSYDAFDFSNGIWVLHKNIILSNAGSENDQKYIKPEKQPIVN